MPTMHLLLAEDDALLSDALTAQLEHAGFKVTHAPNGPVAEFLLLRDSFDAAILDIGLPMLDGLAVLKHVRAKKPELPVLILTALDGLDDRVNGLNAGADDYLTKPFDFPELEARLRALLRRSRPLQVQQAQAVYVTSASQTAPALGKLVFERETRRATVQGQLLELSPREWDLLDLLIQHRDRVVQKHEITSAWADDKGDSPNTPGIIEVYIHRLRRKLEGSGLSIRTVRGLGYLLENDPPESP